MSRPTAEALASLDVALVLAENVVTRRRREVDDLTAKVLAIELDPSYQWPAEGDLAALVQGWSRIALSFRAEPARNRRPRSMDDLRHPERDHTLALEWWRGIHMEADDALVTALGHALVTLDAEAQAHRDAERAMTAARDAVERDHRERAEQARVDAARAAAEARMQVIRRRRGVVPTIHLDWGDE